MVGLDMVGRHKVLVAAGATAAVPLLAWAGFTIASHAVFHRSGFSTASEVTALLRDRRKKLSDPIAFDNYLLEQAKANERAVEVPEVVTFRSSVESRDIDGTQTFLLNRRDRNDRAIVYLHGGNFVRRMTASQWHFVDTVAHRTRAEVFAPMYPLAPVHCALEAHETVERIYRQVVEEYGARNVTLMGDGAGGGLAASLAQRLGALGLEQPAHLILVSPWVDITLDNPLVDVYEENDPVLAAYGLRKIGTLWARGVDPHDPIVSPVNGEVRMMRNVMVFVGRRELFYPDAKLLFDRIAACGIHAELHDGRSFNHGYPLLANRAAAHAIDAIVNAVTED